MFTGDWEELFNIVKNLCIVGLGWLNVLVKTIIFWTIALLPAIVFVTLSILNFSSERWFCIYILLALVSECLWAFLMIVSDNYDR